MMKLPALLLLVPLLLSAHPVRKSHDSVSEDFFLLIKDGYDRVEEYVEGAFELPSCLRVWVRSKSGGDSNANYEFFNCFINLRDRFTFGAPIDDRTYQAILAHELGHAIFTTLAAHESDIPMWRNFKNRRRIERLALANKRRISEIRELKKSAAGDELAKLNQEMRELTGDPVMKEYKEIQFSSVQNKDKGVRMIYRPYTELFADLFASVIFEDPTIMQGGFKESSSERRFRTFIGEPIDLTSWNNYGDYSMFFPVKLHLGANLTFNRDLLVKLLKILDEEMNFVCSKLKYYPKASSEYATLNENMPAYYKRYGLTSELLNRRLIEKLNELYF